MAYLSTDVEHKSSSASCKLYWMDAKEKWLLYDLMFFLNNLLFLSPA